ncbi:excitatory amino acid transporter 2-like isoform X1 [Amphibalanus amphitrite]|uniref:excitatory amino acid transporter 2-like isoform X1 n=1 Tax=Amphibalanus amphitrite TaxID=1232801 RepID=UPI001C9028FA|nr:excitatory amino acid transporter 2-like isoform X1 [Amphibalanus amphitrite]
MSPSTKPTRYAAQAWIKENLLLIATISGVLMGVVLGVSIKPYQPSETARLLIAYPGELFMRLLKLMIVPLVIASLVTGSASLNARMNGKIAMRTVIYFVLTSLLNAVLGILLVVAIHPGDPTMRNAIEQSDQSRRATIMDGLLDLGRNVFPDNLFQASFEQTQTIYKPVATAENVTEQLMKRSVEYRPGTNTLGIIFFCIVFGTVLGTLGEKARVVIQFFAVVDEVIMRMVSGIMWCSPLGIASIICGKILAVPKLGIIMEQLGLFIVTVVVGVLIYQLIIMQLLYLAIVRRNPWPFFWHMREAWLTVFATASTAATLPISLKCVEDKAKVDRRVSRFVLPIGATVNMDGTALFVSVASIFIAQMNNMSLDVGNLVTVALTATAASVASASVPSAALVLMVIVLQAIEAPIPDVSLLFAVDWLVDRFRSTNNCLGDCYTAAIVAHLSRSELSDLRSDTTSDAPDAVSIEDGEKSPLVQSPTKSAAAARDTKVEVMSEKANGGAPLANHSDM